MKILYFGKYCDDEIFEIKKQKKQPFFIAQYMFESALIKGLEKDKDLSIDLVSIYQTEYFPKDDLFFSQYLSNRVFS